jgi:hypothetical protein
MGLFNGFGRAFNGNEQRSVSRGTSRIIIIIRRSDFLVRATYRDMRVGIMRWSFCRESDEADGYFVSRGGNSGKAGAHSG